MCKCINIEPQSQECFDQQIMVGIPVHMAAYQRARVAEGLSPFICIDPCILDEILQLWSMGVITYGSCCGHNKSESFVNVHDKDIPLMLSLGYVQNHPDPSRKDTFKLKTA